MLHGEGRYDNFIFAALAFMDRSRVGKHIPHQALLRRIQHHYQSKLIIKVLSSISIFTMVPMSPLKTFLS